MFNLKFSEHLVRTGERKQNRNGLWPTILTCLKGALLMALAFKPTLIHASSRLFSHSRFRNRKAVIQQVHRPAFSESPTEDIRSPFQNFSLITGGATEPLQVDETEVMAFLRQNNLLAPSGSRLTAISGNRTGVKQFAGYCTQYSSFITNETDCLSWGYTWIDGVGFDSVSASNITSSSFDIHVDLAGAATAYAVVVEVGSDRPTAQQVINGQDSTGSPAIASQSLALNSAPYSGTISFSGLSTSTKYMVYVSNEDGGGAQFDPPKNVDLIYKNGKLAQDASWLYSELVVDSNDNIYVHYDVSNTYYIKQWNGTGWDDVTTYDASTISGSGWYDAPGMAVDSSDNLHVAAWNGSYPNQTLHHLMYNGSSWADTVVSSGYRGNTNVWLTIDGNDRVHITQGTEPGVYYHTNQSGSWTTSTVELGTPDDGYNHTSNKLALVKADNSVDIYYTKENGLVSQIHNTWMRNSNSLGSRSLILDADGDGVRYSLVGGAVDSNDKTHLIYSVYGTGSWYKTDTSGSWATTEFSGLFFKDIKIYGSVIYILVYDGVYHYFKTKDGDGDWVDGRKFFAGAHDMMLFRIAGNTLMIVADDNGPYDLYYHTGSLSDYVSISSNTDPSLTLDSGTLAYTENGAAVSIAPSATATDDDGDSEWDGGTLTVQITANSESADRLTIPDNAVGSINTNGTALRNSGTTIGTLSASEGTVTGSTTLTITFNGSATNALVQQVVRAIYYDNTSDNPTTSNRTATFTLSDNNGGSASGTRTISVSAQNDPPSDIGLSNQSVDEGQPAGTAIGTFSVTDPDG
jgi:hypothetical protein